MRIPAFFQKTVVREATVARATAGKPWFRRPGSGVGAKTPAARDRVSPGASLVTERPAADHAAELLQMAHDQVRLDRLSADLRRKHAGAGPPARPAPPPAPARPGIALRAREIAANAKHARQYATIRRNALETALKYDRSGDVAKAREAFAIATEAKQRAAMHTDLAAELSRQNRPTR